MIFELQLYLITLNIILSLITHVVASILMYPMQSLVVTELKAIMIISRGVDVVSYIVSLAFKNAFTFAKDSSNGL